MSVTTHWDDSQQTAVRLKFASGWTWEQFRNTLAEADRSLKLVSHPVDIIIDLSEHQSQSPMASYYVRQALEWIPPSWQTVVVVSQSTAEIDLWIDAQPLFRGSGCIFYLADSVLQAHSLLAIKHNTSPFTVLSPA